MKNLIIISSLVLAAGSLLADDTPVRSRTITTERAPVRISRNIVEEKRVDRTLEMRVGPRLSFLSGEVQVGRNGTPFDIWDDLGLDEPNGGLQFDVDYQPVSRLHLIFDMTWDRFDQSGVTSKSISNGDAGAVNALASGSHTSANMDIYTFEGRIGYDVIKTESWKVMPYLAGKAGVVDGNVRVVNDGSGGNGRTYTYQDDQAYALPVGGVDARFYVMRQWYLGADIAASGWENFFYLTGQAYTGYDFNKNFGVRLGYDANFVSYENDNRSTRADPLLGAAYVQAVFGF